MNASVLRAVFARNFLSYFSSPTGYVFICLFVALSSIAAFWPNAFFNDNLANLDQLNGRLPYILLIFIPAITMGIWAEERREGTDELLLTIPAGDLDIVLGKYLAAVAIYTVSLAFSLVTNYLVLNQLASPRGFALAPAIDVGLIVGTYLGYWLVGLAMLAVGMVASFLTRILTVAYILGAVFNAPLVFAAVADTILPARLALGVKAWSIGGRMIDFGRGVISLTAVIYFLAIIAVMLYLSVALIGRRHWSRRGGGLMGVHYLLRTLALVMVGVGLTVMAQRHEVRGDVTTEKLSSLSRATRDLLANLKSDRTVVIEAFITPEVPEDYVQTQRALKDTIREMDALSGRIRTRVIDTKASTEEASLAEDRYGITPREVVNRRRDTISVDRIFLGVSIRSGLNRVVIPFFDRGVPVEYELIRSICTVLEEKRKKVGVLVTDVPLYGQFNMQTMSAGRNWPIIDELEKQFDVVRVDANGPIDPKQFDVLLAVQPSSLGPEQMDHFINAVQSGVPTAIFEDPFAFLVSGVPGTSEPRRPPGGMNMMMLRQPPPPKGDIRPLWALLGVDFADDTIVSQEFNPYPKVSEFPQEFVFIDAGNEETRRAFNPDDPISAGLKQVLFPYPGMISKLHVSPLEFVPLAETRDVTSTVQLGDLVQSTPFGPSGGVVQNPRRSRAGAIFCVAAHITGEVNAPAPKSSKEEDANKKEGQAKDADAKKKEDAAKDPKTTKARLNVVLVADFDMLTPGIFVLREQGEAAGMDLHFDFDNVTFVLNVLDSLAGEDRLLEIRKRRRAHHTLARIEAMTRKDRDDAAKEEKKFIEQYDAAVDQLNKQRDDYLRKIEQRMKSERLDQNEVLRRVAMAEQAAQKQATARIKQLEQERDYEIRRVETDLRQTEESVQNWYKMWAVMLPPIPPLVLAIAVFCIRRAREREGVTRARLR